MAQPHTYGFKLRCAVLWIASFFLSLQARADFHFPACVEASQKHEVTSMDGHCGAPPSRDNGFLNFVNSLPMSLPGNDQSCFNGPNGLEPFINQKLETQFKAIQKIQKCAQNTSSSPDCNSLLQGERERLAKPIGSGTISAWTQMHEALAMMKGVDWSSPDAAAQGIRAGKIIQPFTNHASLPPLSAQENNDAQKIVLEGIENVSKHNCPDAEWQKFYPRPDTDMSKAPPIGMKRLPAVIVKNGEWRYADVPGNDSDGRESRLIAACIARAQLIRFSQNPTLVHDSRGNLRVLENLRYFFPRSSFQAFFQGEVCQGAMNYNRDCYKGANGNFYHKTDAVLERAHSPFDVNTYLEGDAPPRLIGGWNSYFKTKLQDYFKDRYWDALNHVPLLPHVSSSNPSNAELANAFGEMSSNMIKLNAKLNSGRVGNIAFNAEEWDFLKFGDLVNNWVAAGNSRCCELLELKATASHIADHATDAVDTAVGIGLTPICAGVGYLGSAALAGACFGVGYAAFGAMDYKIHSDRAIVAEGAAETGHGDHAQAAVATEQEHMSRLNLVLGAAGAVAGPALEGAGALWRSLRGGESLAEVALVDQDPALINRALQRVSDGEAGRAGNVSGSRRMRTSSGSDLSETPAVANQALRSVAGGTVLTPEEAEIAGQLKLLAKISKLGGGQRAVEVVATEISKLRPPEQGRQAELLAAVVKKLMMLNSVSELAGGASKASLEARIKGGGLSAVQQALALRELEDAELLLNRIRTQIRASGRDFTKVAPETLSLIAKDQQFGFTPKQSLARRLPANLPPATSTTRLASTDAMATPIQRRLDFFGSIVDGKSPEEMKANVRRNLSLDQAQVTEQINAVDAMNSKLIEIKSAYKNFLSSSKYTKLSQETQREILKQILKDEELGKDLVPPVTRAKIQEVLDQNVCSVP